MSLVNLSRPFVTLSSIYVLFYDWSHKCYLMLTFQSDWTENELKKKQPMSKDKL